MYLYLTTASEGKLPAPSVSALFRARRILPCALSLVLAAQSYCLNLARPATAVWAADQMSDVAVPSWNDVKSDSAKIFEGSGEPVNGGNNKVDPPAPTPAPAPASAPTPTPTPAIAPAKEAIAPPAVPEKEAETGSGKAIADVTNIAPTEASTTTTAAPLLAPTAAEVKESPLSAEKPAEKSGSPAPQAQGGLKAPPQVGAVGAAGTVDSLSGEMLKSIGAKVEVIETVTEADGTVKEGEVMVVDCDQKTVLEEEIKYQNLETDEGKTHIKAGAVFPVVISSQITSKTSKKGDPIEARLKYDLKIGDRLIAHKGAEVHGHINYALKARPALRALVSHERWYRNAGCIGLEFDEIINEKGEHLPLVACPARAARIVNNKNEGRLLGVNKEGQIACPSTQQWSDRAVRIGIHAALAPAGVFSFGAVPLALGLYGAANPSFAFMKPVGVNVRHRRIKGFAWGFISGVPGGMIIEDSIVKGQESVIKPGDEFLAEFRQEFNGQPAAEVQLMPNTTVKVHGEITTEDSQDSQDKNKGQDQTSDKSPDKSQEKTLDKSPDKIQE